MSAPRDANLEADFPELDDADVENDLNADLRKLATLNAEAQKLEKKAKDKRAELNAWRAKCYERMEDEEVESTRVGGNLFVRNEPTWFSTIQDEASLFAWLRENRPGILQTKAVEKELNKLARACLEDGRPFPPGLGAYPRKIVAVRK
jgi:phage host-nuclease inhibitor protein Gam